MEPLRLQNFVESTLRFSPVDGGIGLDHIVFA